MQIRGPYSAFIGLVMVVIGFIILFVLSFHG
jgi:hypothetical protein